MKNEVQVVRKTKCGSEYVYPDSETARLFCKLTKRRTFSKEMLLIIRELGYVLVETVEEE